MEPTFSDLFQLAENVGGIVYSFCLVITFFTSFFWGLYGR